MKSKTKSVNSCMKSKTKPVNSCMKSKTNCAVLEKGNVGCCATGSWCCSKSTGRFFPIDRRGKEEELKELQRKVGKRYNCIKFKKVSNENRWKFINKSWTTSGSNTSLAWTRWRTRSVQKRKKNRCSKIAEGFSNPLMPLYLEYNNSQFGLVHVCDCEMNTRPSIIDHRSDCLTKISIR